MDTFIGSTDREKKRRAVMGPGQCRSVALLMRSSQKVAYRITHHHWGQGLMNAVMAHEGRR